MSIIKVSIEITDSYDRIDFRNYIKYLLSMDTKYEVFIISTNTNSVYIQAVGEQFGIPVANRIVCLSNEDKIAAINENSIDIHLDNVQSLVDIIDAETNAYAILVSHTWHRFLVKLMYVVRFERAVEQVLEDRNET